MKSKNKTKLAMALACALSLGYTGIGYADPVEKSVEPNNLINLDVAQKDFLKYNENDKTNEINLSDVTVGVIDCGNVGIEFKDGKIIDHKELKNVENIKNIKLNDSDYKYIDDHATHVSGIIAAAKDKVGMYGVAPGARLVVDKFYLEDPNVLKASIDNMNKNEKIKVINNSWGNDVYLDVLGKGVGEYKSRVGDHVQILASAVKAGKLLVFASGNNGHPTPGGESILPYMDASVKNNFINVVNLNSNPVNGKRDGTKINIAKSEFINPDSDLAKYAEFYTLAAPGTNILSTTTTAKSEVTLGSNPYQYKTGTSMAAPMVSGVGALVQSKFKYMSGKQIADVLLSTANKDLSYKTKDAYFFTLQSRKEKRIDEKTGEPKDVFIAEGIHVYFLGGEDEVKAAKLKEDIKAKLIKYMDDEKYDEEYGKQLKAGYIDFMGKNETKFYYNTPYELIFGQGVLDAGKAVNGPGALNARRLSAADYSSDYNTNGEALYKVDTMGFDSTWSNNIGEVKVGKLSADSSQADLKKIYDFYSNQNTAIKIDGRDTTQEKEYIDWYNKNVYVEDLENLPVGLLKSGAGTLTLSGNNTYKGSSVVNNGTLRIDGSVDGNAVAIGGGIIGGNGTIRGKLSLKENGMVMTGNPGSVSTKAKKIGLTVNGDLEGANGRYGLAADKDGNVLTLEVKGNADITSGVVVKVGDYQNKPGDNYKILSAKTIKGEMAKGELTALLSYEQTGNTEKSALERSSKTGSDTEAEGMVSAEIVLKANYNLTDKDAEDYEVFDLLEEMRDHMEKNSSQFTKDQFDELYEVYNLDVEDANAAFDDLYGGTAMSLASTTVRNGFVEKSVHERVNGNVQFIDQTSGQGNLWFRMGKEWGNVKADDVFDKANSQSFGAIVGYDKQVNKNWLWGGYISYNNNKLNATDGTGKNHDLRLGTYGKYQKQAFDLLLNMNVGGQNNTTQSELLFAGVGVDGKYQSKTVQLTAKAAYDLNYGKKNAWSVKPYVGLSYTNYRQDSYNESANSIFAQQVEGMSMNYAAGELGIDFKRAIENGTFKINLGYKRVLSGYNPAVNVSMSALPGYYLEVNGVDYGRDFLTIGTGIDLKMKNNWTMNAKLDGEFGRRSSNYGVSLNFTKNW